MLALTVIAEFFVHLHPHFEIEGLFGFHAVYGFIACAADDRGRQGAGAADQAARYASTPEDDADE